MGHIGSALSIADIVAELYDEVLSIERWDAPDRDRFVLSKGHAALALYAAMHLKGLLTASELESFCANGTAVGVHPEHSVAGIDFSTGSLGHGLGMGTGAALAARMEGSHRKVYVLMSDAECNEGSVWEAAMFAAHHRLSNLSALIDDNGQQALGYTKDVLDLGPLEEKWRAFGWDVAKVDGHDSVGIRNAIAAPRDGKPRAIVCKTTFGKGVSFMEGQIKWHYLPMTESEYNSALAEVA